MAWAVGPGDDIRQIALVTDWCDELISRDDRTQIEFFNGPHTIHGVGTFAFLDRFLKSP